MKLSHLKYIACVLVIIFFVSLAMDRPPESGGSRQAIKNDVIKPAGRIGLVETDPKKILSTFLDTYSANERDNLSNQSIIDAIISLIKHHPELMREEIYTGLSLLIIFTSLDSYIPIVQQLFNSDINMNVDFKMAGDGVTALIMASYNGNIKMVQLLLNHGAHVDIQDEDGSNALMTALESTEIGNNVQRLKIMRLLLDAGANISLRNNKKQTVFDLAVNKPQVLALLNEYKKERIK